MISIENRLYGTNIGSRTHKTMSNEIDIFFDSQHDVMTVFVGQCRQVDMTSRYIDTLVATQLSIILYLCNNSRSVDIQYQHIECTIIEENVVAHLHIVGKINIREIDDIMLCIHFRTTEDLHHIARFIINRLVTTGSAYLRTFSINEQANMVAHSTCI